MALLYDFRIQFTNNWSFWVVFLGALVLSLLCLYWTRRALGTVGRRWNWIFFWLRWAALVLLIAFLVNPVLSYRSFRIKRGGVAVLLDTSRSMAVRDSIGGAARLDAACKRALAHDSPHYRTVKTILAGGHDLAPVSTITPEPYAGRARFARATASLFEDDSTTFH